MHYHARILFGSVGLGFSLFYGIYVKEIWTQPQDRHKLRSMPWAWHFHQAWHNFIGSAVGWAAAYYYVFYRLCPLSKFSFKVEDTIVILIAVLGIMGFLPYALSKINLR
jgi:hypothetical protein